LEDLIIKKKTYFSAFKVLQFFLLTLLLLSFLLTSGCAPISNLLFGPSFGSIEVTTYPSGAKIFLNDKDTGYITPYTITNLNKGTYEVKVTLGDIGYTKTVIVYSDNTTSVYKDLLPRLKEIIIKTSIIYINIGETRIFPSITAYYFDGDHLPIEIKLSDCNYTKDSDHAIINSKEGTFTGISKGLTRVTVSYTEREFTKSDVADIFIGITPIYPVPVKLTSIVVFPSSMNLDIGESKTISSITAHYNDASSESVALSDCSYSSDNICATVDSNGTITGVSEGLAVITVSYTKKEITKTDTVEVIVGDIVYRAFCIGVGDYQNFPDAYGNTDLLGPPYDVDRIIDVFDHCKFGTDEVVFSTLVSLKDLNATKTAIISGIASTFSGADDNDVSYFYFSGHGMNYEGISYLCPTEVMDTSSLSAYISTNELESALSAIPGRKVVILDSCYSGGFIGKGKEEITISKKELTSFNDEVINVFSQAQSKGLLTTNQYKVLTSCHYNQSCWGTSPHPDGNPYGAFTRAFCNGCGYDDGVSYADSNTDTKITLDELYEHIRDFITDVFDYDQDVQVFPDNSNFTIVEH